MATVAEHKAKWLHNREFLGTIDDRFADWMATVMFYSALHAVEALFAHDGARVHGGHTQRNQTLKTVNRYKAIWRNYHPLLDAARTARYEVEGASWIPAEDVKNHLVRYLYRLEQSVLKLMDTGNTLKPVW